MITYLTLSGYRAADIAPARETARKYGLRLDWTLEKAPFRRERVTLTFANPSGSASAQRALVGLAEVFGAAG